MRELNIMIRRVREVTVQGKNGFLVEGQLEKDMKDVERLKAKGFYVYGVRENAGLPWVLEDSMVVHNHYGYIVLKEPVVFRERKNPIDNLCSKYFVLNNQHSKISDKKHTINLLNAKHF